MATDDEEPDSGFDLISLADRLGVSPASIVVGIAAIAAAGLGAWWALRSPPTPNVEATLPVAGAVTVATPAPSTTVAPTVFVHVVGAVERPGVHEIDAGGRVLDAVVAAGGLRPDADEARLNLAAPLVAGARLWVPAVGEGVEPDVIEPTPAAGGSGGADPELIDINSAVAGDLESLPGIGPTLARAIVDHRQRLGPFRTVDDLDAVPGIGPAKLEQLRPHVRS